MKGVNIFLADGFEEIEALAPYDILSRGGVDVRLVSIDGSRSVCGAHGISVGTDWSLDELEPGCNGAGDMMIFPGGLPGAENLAGCARLIEAMNRHYSEGGDIAAICAAPGLVLAALEGAEPFEFTCYEGFQAALQAWGCSYNPQAAVVTNGRIITGRGPGAALHFGAALLRKIKGDDTADRVIEGMYIK